MNAKAEISPERLQELLNVAKLGWWKADFGKGCYLCSDFIVKLLGLDSEILPFENFRLLISSRYRDRITKEFTSIKTEEIYEQTFPLMTRFGEIWIHSRLGKKEKDESGNLIAWGFLQQVSDPQAIQTERALEKFNSHLHQQNKISRSLSYFLQTENSSEVIYKILHNLLDQFHANRTYIIEYDLEKQLQNYSFKVNSENVSLPHPLIADLPMSATPWWTQQMTSHLPILLSTPEDLPQEAQREKQMLESQGIKSLMVIPMFAQDKVWGYMGIDMVNHYHSWSYEEYQWFASLGNIISICMELHRSKNKTLKEREYFKNIYKYMPIGYVRLKLLYDSRGQLYNYRFVDLNPAFSTITGIQREILIDHTIREVDLSMDIEKQIQELKKIQKSPTFTQVNFSNPFKEQYYRCIVYSPESDEIVCLFSDITETHKAHKALDRREKELRNIYRNIPVGIEIYDKRGYLRDMNQKDMEIFGLKNKGWGLGVNLFDNPNIPEIIKQQIREQKRVDFQIKYDFSEIKDYYHSEQFGIKDLIVKVSPLYNSDHELENYILIIIDNTETSTAYSKIQEFENFFSMIADFAKVGYFKWNLHKKTGFALEQWFKNWGEPADSRLEDVVGIYRMLHPDDHDKIIELYQKLISGELKGSKEEVRVRDEKDGWKWIRSSVIVTKYEPEQQDIELIGVNFDITELKEIEAKLIEAKDKAETLDKLKSAFLANMSHEIRTPLNAIVGFSNLLLDTQDLGEQKQYISIIQENNDLLLQLISDILDLSKMEAGTFEIVYGDVDVNVLCHEIVRSLQLKTPPGVVLEFEHYEPECHLTCDRNRLMQLLTNFINNAVKFTTKGSIRLGYYLQDDEIEFYVSDTGIGIPAQKLGSIFERFVKLNSFIHGTGLGLSICRSIVEQMGGHIGVESEEGKGSRFWFTLPYGHSQDSPLTTADVADDVSNLKAKPRVLIAEDTENHFILLSTILKKKYVFFWAHNGQEAIELYQQEHPDIILMDIHMPEMDGLEATRHIRESDKNIPIIAMTAYMHDHDRHQVETAGCNAYLAKPVNATLLKRTIQELIM